MVVSIRVVNPNSCFVCILFVPFEILLSLYNQNTIDIYTLSLPILVFLPLPYSHIHIPGI